MNGEPLAERFPMLLAIHIALRERKFGIGIKLCWLYVGNSDGAGVCITLFGFWCPIAGLKTRYSTLFNRFETS